MRETLEEGLKWFCDEKRGRGCLLVLKLEARSNNYLFCEPLFTIFICTDLERCCGKTYQKMWLKMLLE